ncbi:mas-related G-protein coupled receptor member H-like [Anolis sagrei]|uniref:mas-related G-protein coupled receptor member H-like n=1 Tax=Anolis sagrei TaxID=38937 RepID=UPI003521E91C
MTNFNKSLFSSLNAEVEYNDTEWLGNNSFPNNKNDDAIEIFITASISHLICLLGLVGNGIFIRLLDFHIKKNPFTTYLLNLSIADIVLLIVQAINNVFEILNIFGKISFMIYVRIVYYAIFLFSFTTSQFLQTSISINRCMCLFFSLEHPCHQQPHLPTAVCIIIWILSFLISATHLILVCSIRYYWLGSLQFFFNAVIFTPIMCVSTIATLIKICLRSQQNKWGELLRAILLPRVFFLLFAFPVHVIYSCELFQQPHFYFYLYAYICASLNSSINPVIHYLVEIKWGEPAREYI